MLPIYCCDFNRFPFSKAKAEFVHRIYNAMQWFIVSWEEKKNTVSSVATLARGRYRINAVLSSRAFLN
jgi:hypothetical protein